MCRALIGNGAKPAYASSTLINHINKKSVRTETKKIETLMSTNIRKIKIYSEKIQVFLELPNPKYRELLNIFANLRDLQINDHDLKSKLPVLVILDISGYTKIKTQERPRVGRPGEPIAELTKFGWVFASPGQETGVTNMLFSKTSLHDYEKYCSLDCLGIEKRRDDSDYVFEEFQKQMGHGPGGFYETNLIWKDNQPPKSNSLGRLSNLVKNVTHINQLERYDNIIQDHIKEGIVEKIDEVCEQEISEEEKVFYLPHRLVIRESAKTTKLRIIYDASSKPNKNSSSLNYCLETGSVGYVVISKRSSYRYEYDNVTEIFRVFIE